MIEESKELTTLVQESGLEPTKAQYLLDHFSSYFAIAADWEVKARVITVTADTQVAEMKMAREGRLFLRAKRIEVENARKKLKEQSLRESKAIDGIANVLKALIVPIEEYLDEQEHFVEKKRALEDEARRIEALKALAEKLERERLEKEAEERRIREENEKLRKETEQVTGSNTWGKIKEYKRTKQTLLKDYDKVPPTHVLDALETAQAHGCFDKYEVMTIKSHREVPDPILFGHAEGSTDLFYIAQWDTDIKIEDILKDHEGWKFLDSK